MYNINTHLEVSDNIDAMLDKIIETSFEEYSLTKIFSKNNWYITEKDEISINKEITALVVKRLSPVITQQLGILYNQNAIVDIIAKRVYFKVTDFVIQHNRDINI